MNVLQRFGIAYFVVATMYILMALPLNCPDECGRWRKAFQDMIALFPQWLVALAAVVLHLVLVFGTTVDHCERYFVFIGSFKIKILIVNSQQGILWSRWQS